MGTDSGQEIKINFGSATLPNKTTNEVREDQIKPPRTVKISTEETREALKEPVTSMINAVGRWWSRPRRS